MTEIHYLATDEWKYSLNSDGKITLTKYLKEDPTELEIPDEINGNPVIALEAQLLRGQISLKQVKFPKTLKNIGYEAFYGCSNLTIRSTDLPKTLVKIGDRAFWRCKLVCDVPSETDNGDVFAFPPSCEYIGNAAFYGTRFDTLGKSKLVLPSTIKALGDNAFSISDLAYVRCECYVSAFCFGGCHELEKAIVSKSVGNGAFRDCEKLKNVELKEGVANIGEYSFAETAIESVAFPKSLKAIREGAFRSCKALELISFESTVSIGKKAFYSMFHNPIKKIGLPLEIQDAIDNGKKLNKKQAAFVKALVKNEIEIKDYSLLMALAATI